MGSESLAFKDWVKSENLLASANLNRDWSSKKIGIDAEDYLHTLLTNPQTREPLLPALGGLPFALHDHVEKDLEEFRKADIRPIFVFNGLDIGCKDRKVISKESQKAVQILDEAWRVYDQGRGDDAVIAFGKACTYRTAHIARYLQFYLARNGIEVWIAPYAAAAQLAHLEGTGYIQGVMGSASILVFGVDKVITSFDWESQKVHFAKQDAILSKLGLTHSQFVDLCLLSGSSILSTLPEIDSESTTSKLAAARTVLTRAGNDGHTVCLQAKDAEYLDLFRKAKTAVQHMVVINDKGHYQQLDFDNAPSDTHDFISQRLPDELMFYHQVGLISSRVLNWRARSEIFETPPLDGGSSQAYRDLVQDKLRPMRSRCLAVLTKSLHRYYTKQDVNLVCWFSENDKKALGLPDTPFSEVAKDAESWHVKESLLHEASHVKGIDLTKCPIQYAITALSDDATAKKTVTRRKDGEHSVIDTSSEFLSNALWRFLQDRGYINSDHTLSAWGKALMAAFERAISDKLLGSSDVLPGEAEEAIFVAFELLRLDTLNSKPTFLQPPYTGAPMRGSDTDKAHVNLISRVACFGTFKHHAIGYTGPLSRHLLAFHQLAAAVRNALRDLTDVHACNMMLSGSASRDKDEDEYIHIAAKLPFGKEPDLGLALVVKSYLDEQSQDPSRRANVKNWFNHAEDIDGDLAKAWKVWAAINAGVQAADSAIVSSETKNMFQNADAWLQQKKSKPIANGTNGV